MSADSRLKRFLVDRAPLDEEFIGQHQGRGGGQTGCKVFRRAIGFSGLGQRFDFQIVFFSQPGKHLHEAPSGFAHRFVEKDAQLDHFISPVRAIPIA
jgi:hypothetical protein